MCKAKCSNERYRKASKRWNRQAEAKNYNKTRERIESLITFVIGALVATTLLFIWESIAVCLKTGVFALFTNDSTVVNYMHNMLQEMRVVHLLLQGCVIATIVFWGCAREEGVWKRCNEKFPVAIRGGIFIIATGAALELTNITAFLMEFCISAIIAGVTSIMPTIEVTNIIRISLLIEQFDPITRLLEGFILLSLRGMFQNYRNATR